MKEPNQYNTRSDRDQNTSLRERKVVLVITSASSLSLSHHRTYVLCITQACMRV
jgi:hypothetical protein